MDGLEALVGELQQQARLSDTCRAIEQAENQTETRGSIQSSGIESGWQQGKRTDLCRR
jgi:hypothetical protein